MLWFCRHCRISFSGVKKMLYRVTKLEQTRVDFTERQEKLLKKVDNLKNKKLAYTAINEHTNTHEVREKQ